MVAALPTKVQTRPVFAAEYRHRVVEPRREEARAVFRRAIDRGDANRCCVQNWPIGCGVYLVANAHSSRSPGAHPGRVSFLPGAFYVSRGRRGWRSPNAWSPRRFPP
jgi:tetracycline repressor-like protein